MLIMAIFKKSLQKLAGVFTQVAKRRRTTRTFSGQGRFSEIRALP